LVERAVARGLLHGYRREEAALTNVRGRIRFDDQLRSHFGRLPPVEVGYDEFTADVTENRLLKAALVRLGRLHLRSDAGRAALHRFDSLLENVALVQYDSRQLPTVTFTRLNERYRPAVELARLILRSLSFELRGGRVHASSFLVGMSDVFERFVYAALREALGLTEQSFPRGCRGHPLALDRRWAVALEPDLSWWEAGACTFVGDVKYKRLELIGFRHADLYQLLAYTTAADLPTGMLVYAAGEAPPATHEVVHAGKRLEVLTLDLSGEPTQILTQVGRVAGRVRAMRAARSSLAA
jgi:5-methylcytosine-specific restriction enzyme subunit McrC